MAWAYYKKTITVNLKLSNSIFNKNFRSIYAYFNTMSGKYKYHRKHEMKNKKSSRNDGSEKHPPHLRGKEIGLFYARRNKLKRTYEKEAKPLGTVLLSTDRKEHIQNLLDENAQVPKCTIGNSEFKKKFFNIIKGNMRDKLTVFKELNQDSTLDEQLLSDFNQQKESACYKKLQEYRKLLPAYQKRQEILKIITENPVTVISGETGCGKTTQIPQFILDQYLEDKRGSVCHIICTQPRRISAISVADRVAQERGETLGHSIGYQIRLEKQLPRTKGCITFCTTGVILKQMENDPFLANVSHIILDEIHERDIMSDFLITLLKEILPIRKDLKIILMSATLNSEKFSKYYNSCPHMNIPGFTYPVQEYYLEDVLQRTRYSFDEFAKTKNLKKTTDTFYSDYMEPHIRKLESEKIYSPHVCRELRNPFLEELNVELVLALLIDICEKEESQGAVLIFLTGFAEISALNQLIDESGQFPTNKYLIIPLHSHMPTVNQREIFERPPEGVRKIIIATNIAETSITIDDVVFVIDCGKIKIRNFDVEANTYTLKPEWVSLANANQRKGRAGRVQPGICFHLFTRVRNMLLDQYQKPEILRSRLENTILSIKILQLGKAKSFLERLMDCPQSDAIDVSLQLLKRLEALDENENLTPLGYHLARLPVSPQIGKMLLLSAIFSCVNPVLSVAASLDFKDAFQTPLGKEKQADERRLELSENCKSDHLLLYHALNRFGQLDDRGAKQFCWHYFLSYSTLKQLQNMKRQFMEYLYEMNFVARKDPRCYEHNVNSQNLSLVKAIICAGLYPNVATVRRYRFISKIRIIEDDVSARFHPKSVLYNEVSFDSPLLVYHLKLRSSEIFVHDATIIHPLPLIFFGDNYKYNDNGKHTTISIGTDKLLFKCSRSTNDIIKQLRDRLNLILENKVSNPSIVNWQTDEKQILVLRAIIELITSEDIGEIDLDAYDDEN